MKTVALAEIADQVRGVSYGREDVVDRPMEGYMPVLRANNITEEGLDLSDLVFVRSNKVADRQKIRSGDIVIAASSGSISVVGKSAQARKDLDAGFGAFCKVVRPSGRVDQLYLGHFFRTPTYRQKMSALAAGANINNLKNEHIDELEIPLPPLEEQKRIAAILDKADELRRKRQRALDRLNQLGQAIFIEMFVGGEQPEWPTLLVEQLVDESSGGIRTGPFGSQLLHSEFVDDGVAVLGIDNAVSNQFQWGQRRYITLDKYNALKRYRVYPGDVIITIMGTCGRCAIVPPEIPLAINTKHLCCISLQREACAPEYLHAYFMTHPTALEYLRSKSKGAIMDGLNMGIIKSMPVRLPPLNLQEQFVIRLSAIERQRGSASDACELGDQLFASLQHCAFRGEL
jgi:type I restriction enzyme S subunit